MPNQTCLSQRRSESGSTIVLALIGISCVAILELALAQIEASANRTQAKLNLLNVVSEIQLRIWNTVNDSNSWAVTTSDLAHNAAMGCLLSGPCPAVASTNFVLWPAGTSSYAKLASATYDGTNSSAGFTLAGVPCSSFKKTGSPDCPLHVDLKFSASACATGPCPVWIDADIWYRPGTTSSGNGTINEANLKLGFPQTSTHYQVSCSGPIPSAEAAACAPPPYTDDSIVCTGSGWRCGRVYYP